MQYLADKFEAVMAFMSAGGIVLWAIAILTFVMWLLIFERFFFYKGALNKLIKQTIDVWEARPERTSWNSHQIRDAMISRVGQRIDDKLDFLGTLVALCPLMGLLGTVWGMIQVFEVLAYTGGGDAKSMAAGVSMATIPTMAGMVAALSGVFGTTFINRIAERENRLLSDQLTMDH